MKKTFVFLLLLGALVDLNGADARSLRNSALPNVEVNLEAIDALKNTEEYNPVNVEFEVIEDFPALKKQEIQEALQKQEEENERRQSEIMIFQSDKNKEDKLLSNIAKKENKKVESNKLTPGSLGIEDKFVKESFEVNEAAEKISESKDEAPLVVEEINEEEFEVKEVKLPAKLPSEDEEAVKKIVIKGRDSQEEKTEEKKSVFSLFGKILSQDKKEEKISDSRQLEEELNTDEPYTDLSVIPDNKEEDIEIVQPDFIEDFSKPVVIMPKVVEAEDEPALVQEQEQNAEQKRTVFSLFNKLNIFSKSKAEEEEEEVEPVEIIEAEENVEEVFVSADEPEFKVVPSLKNAEHSSNEKDEFAEVKPVEILEAEEAVYGEEIEEKKPFFKKFTSFFKPYKGDLEVKNDTLQVVEADESEDLISSLPEEIEGEEVVSFGSPLPVLKEQPSSIFNKTESGKFKAVNERPEASYSQVILPNEIKNIDVYKEIPTPEFKPFEAAKLEEKINASKAKEISVAQKQDTKEDKSAADGAEKKGEKDIIKEVAEAKPSVVASTEKEIAKDDFLKKVASKIKQTREQKASEAKVAESQVVAEIQKEEEKVATPLQKVEKTEQLASQENESRKEEILKKILDAKVAVVGSNVVIQENNDPKEEVVVAKDEKEDSRFSSIIELISKTQKKAEEIKVAAKQKIAPVEEVAELKEASLEKVSDEAVKDQEENNLLISKEIADEKVDFSAKRPKIISEEDAKRNEILAKIRKLKESGKPIDMLEEQENSLPSGLELVNKIKEEAKEKEAELGAQKISPDKFIAANRALTKIEEKPESEQTLKIASVNPTQNTQNKPSENGELLTIDYQGVEVALTDFDKNRLRELVQQIQEDKNKRLKIVSYATGEEGKTNSARRISLQRAISIRSQMINAGLESIRINVQAIGDKAEANRSSNSVKVYLLDN